MSQTIKNLLAEALIDQKEFFGDDLLSQIDIKIENRDVESPAPAETFKIKINSKKSDTVEEPKIKEVSEEFQSTSSLDQLNSMINHCMKCDLGSTRKNFVFGVGNPESDIMIIGEAPGADEDEQGEPFVGKAGKLLNDILKAINFNREEVYIANILKCRPPGNRNPKSEEMDLCMPYLFKQIDIINPKVILCLGRVAATGLLKNKLSLTQMRGKIYDWNDRKLMVTYHPAALLRNPNWKRGCWEDVQKLKKLYDELVGN